MSTENREVIDVSDEVIAVCAVNATLKTDGVAGMAGGFSDAFARNFLGHESAAKGVKITRNDDRIKADIYIFVLYGHKIPAVAWDIQENVKKEIKDMTGISLKSVNIHVQGVKMPEEQ